MLVRCRWKMENVNLQRGIWYLIYVRPTSMGLHQLPGWVSKHHEDVANHSSESTSEGTRWLSDTLFLLGRLKWRTDTSR